MGVVGAVLGGLIGGAAMVVILYTMRTIMPAQMKMNLLLLLGTMFVPAGAVAYAAGFMVHGMMSVAFGLIHGGLLAASGVESAGFGLAVGALFGAGHALITGAMLGLVPLVHPRVRSERPKLLPAFAGLAPSSSEKLLDPPGFFGLNYPPLTVIGFVMLHVIFGAVVGVLFGAFA